MKSGVVSDFLFSFRGVTSVGAVGVYAANVLKRGGLCSYSKYALYEIPNSMFLPPMKKSFHIWYNGADANTLNQKGHEKSF